MEPSLSLTAPLYKEERQAQPVKTRSLVPGSRILPRLLLQALSLVVLWLVPVTTASASTIAYWRFEGVNGVPMGNQDLLVGDVLKDEVGLYDLTVTQAEAIQSFSPSAGNDLVNPDPLDDSPPTNGTVNGGGINGKALNFYYHEGAAAGRPSSDAVFDFDAGEGFTVEILHLSGWFFRGILAGKRAEDGQGWEVRVVGDQLEFYCQAGDGTIGGVSATLPPSWFGVLNHIACVRHDGTLKADGLLEIYVNGDPVPTNVITGSTDTQAGNLSNAAPLVVGGSIEGVGAYVLLDELRISSEPLQPDDFFQQYASLELTSTHGDPEPGPGFYYFPKGREITATIEAEILEDFPLRRSMTGWTGSGSVPTEGSANTVTFTLTEDSTLTWNWVEIIETVRVILADVSGYEGEPTTVDASATMTTEPPVSYRFDFEADGVWDTDFQPEAIITHVYPGIWEGTAWVEAMDAAGGTSVAEAPVVIGGTLPYVENRGDLFVVIEDKYPDLLAAEIARFVLDLEGEDWNVVMLPVDVETATVTGVKQMILDAAALEDNPRGVILIGDIPQPMSGYAGPDGHKSRPMPADLYYADITGHINWTDTEDFSLQGPGNVPGDGIMDPNSVPESRYRTPQVDMFVGRIIPDGTEPFRNIGDVELLRRYLVKLHRYKSGELRAGMKSLQYHRHDYIQPESLDDASHLFGQPEDSIRTTNIDQALRMRTRDDFRAIYAVAGTTGAPGKDMANRAVSMHHFADSLEPQTLFWSQFGSWFVETRPNTLMAATILGERWGLLAFWPDWGRWITKTASADRPFGYTQINRTQSRYGNNTKVPIPVWSNLIGDPTLRFWIVDPPREPRVEATGPANRLIWEASPESVSELRGYAVYRSDGLHGEFTRISPEVITELEFLDESPPVHAHYRIHAVARFVDHNSEQNNRFLVRSQPARAQFDRGSAALPPPQAELRVEARERYAPTEVKFIASHSTQADGAIVQYDWDFGDGRTESTLTGDVFHSYPDPGDYTVSVTVTNDAGASDTASDTVRIQGYHAPLYLNEIIESRSMNWEHTQGIYVLMDQVPDAEYHFQPLVRGGRPYYKTLMSLSKSRLTFDLGGRFTKLETGVAAYIVKEGETVQMRVAVDGVAQVLGVYGHGDVPEFFEIDLTGAQELMLISEPSASDARFDAGVWVSPKLTPAPDGGLAAHLKAPDQAAEGQRVILDGGGTLGEPVNFSWTQDSGPVVELDPAGERAVSFVAPPVDSPVDVVVRLTVDDGGSLQSTYLHTCTIYPADEDGLLFAEDFGDDEPGKAPRLSRERSPVNGMIFETAAQPDPMLGNWDVVWHWPDMNFWDPHDRDDFVPGFALEQSGSWFDGRDYLRMRDDFGLPHIRMEKHGVVSPTGVIQYEFEVFFRIDAGEGDSLIFLGGDGDLTDPSDRFFELRLIKPAAGATSVVNVTLNGVELPVLTAGTPHRIQLEANDASVDQAGIDPHSVSLIINGQSVAASIPRANAVALRDFGFHTADDDTAPGTEGVGIAAIRVRSVDPDRIDEQQVLHVDAGVVGGAADGSSWADAFPGIAAALAAAAEGAQIRVAQGVYPVSATLELPNSAHLIGGYAGGAGEDANVRDPQLYPSVLDAAGHDITILHLDNRHFTVIEGLTFRNGTASIFDGTYLHGGGICLSNGSSNNLIVDCVFHACIGKSFGTEFSAGGGISVRPNCSFNTIRRSVFIDCSASGSKNKGHGSAIAVAGAQTVIEDCTISFNSGSRAAVAFEDGSAGSVITRSTLTGNYGSFGGGAIACLTRAVSIEISNCLIVANSVRDARVEGGAGIFAGVSFGTAPDPIIINNTIAYNQGTTDGSGAFNGGGVTLYARGTDAIIRNNIFLGNTGYAIREQSTEVDPAEVSHNLFHDNPDGDYYDENATLFSGAAAVDAGVAEATANLDGDPLMLPGPSGTWGATPIFNPLTVQTTLCDPAASFTPGRLTGLLLQGDTGSFEQAVIADNSATCIVVWGDLTGLFANGDSYQVHDYLIGAGSSAIDAASAAGAPTLDRERRIRPYDVSGIGSSGGDAFDIGAFEFGAHYHLTLASFRKQHFNESQIADPSIAGDTADPDNDGLPVLLEYALGLSPLRPDAIPSARVSADGGALTYRFQSDPNAMDAEFVVETSGDLQTWTPLAGGLQIIEEDSDRRTYEVSVPLDGSSLFIRIVVNRIP